MPPIVGCAASLPESRARSDIALIGVELLYHFSKIHVHKSIKESCVARGKMPRLLYALLFQGHDISIQIQVRCRDQSAHFRIAQKMRLKPCRARVEAVRAILHVSALLCAPGISRHFSTNAWNVA